MVAWCSCANDFLSVLPLCCLCVSSSGFAHPIVAFCTLYLNKDGMQEQYHCVMRHPEGLCSPFASSAFVYISRIKSTHNHSIELQTDNTFEATKYLLKQTNHTPTTRQTTHKTTLTTTKDESPRPRPRRPLPHHLHPPRQRLLRRHDLLHPGPRRR